MDEIEQILVNLTDADLNVRWKAVAAAREHRFDKRVIEALFDRLADPAPEVRAQTARLLFWAYDPRNGAALALLLNDRDPEVRRAAAEGLRGRYFRDALDALLGGLHDPDPEVRAEVAYTLGSYASYRVVRQLVWTLGDGNAEVRKQAARSLIELDHYDAIQPLLHLALDESEDSEVRQQTIESLGYLAHKGNVKFIDLIDDERDVVRQLINLMSDADEAVARAAIDALERLGDERAVVPLVALLCDWYADFGLRLGAVSALGNLKDFRVTPILIAALQDPEPLMRPFAAQALGDLCDPAALPALDRLVDGERDKLGQAAEEAAAKIRYELSWQEFDRVVEYLRQGDMHEQERALHCLSTWDDVQAMDLILEMLTSYMQTEKMPDNILCFAEAAKIVANKGEARALPILAEAVEYWTARKVPGLVDDAEEAANYIRRKLNGDELGTFISSSDEEEYELDDLDEADSPGLLGNV